MLTTESSIGPGHLPSYLGAERGKQTQGENSLDGAVKRHIEAVLQDCRGNRSRAAKELGISRRSLIRKIEKYSVKA